ncbi:MAG: hypothetical protein JNJ49_10455 [Bdellovibrionaceae bacterium]|nr:hypothetical protein [Pseudobdellovibrionaceae bacterium]
MGKSKVSPFLSRTIRHPAAFVVVAAALLTLSFQNCAPQPMDQSDSTASSSGDMISGNSSYRLPPSQNQQFNSGITCSVAVNATSIAANANLTYTITASGTLPTGYKVITYGTKNNVVDQFGGETSTNLILSYTNPGYLAGNYTRYFQIIDSAGRALCQTNTVAVTLQGRGCTLSTDTSFIKVGQAIILNISYAQTNPTGAVLKWYGSNNDVEIAGDNYGQTNINQWVSVANESNRGVRYVRRLVVHNADNSIFCQTNNVRVRVD